MVNSMVTTVSHHISPVNVICKLLVNAIYIEIGRCCVTHHAEPALAYSQGPPTLYQIYGPKELEGTL